MKIKFFMRLLSVIGILFVTPIVAETMTNEKLKALTEEAEQGDIQAQFLLSSMYHIGDGVEKNIQTATMWTIKSAELGNANAQYGAGLAYEFGTGVKQDNQKAIEWYTKAAEQGNTDSQLVLGDIYREGKITKQDYQKAIKWYTKVIKEILDSEALYQLGLMYQRGQGVEKNNIIAYNLFMEAIENGSSGNQATLALEKLEKEMTPEEIAKAKQINPLELK